MAASRRTLKVLWARSAGRCAVCRDELAEAHNSPSDIKPLGETAHIVSSSSEGPRGAALLTKEERDSYHNLILLCPTHHRQVDQDPRKYPAEKLFILKSMHEQWVARQLGPSGCTPDHLSPIDYDPQDVVNVLKAWLEGVRRIPGAKTVHFREIEAEVGIDAGVAREHLPDLLSKEGLEIIGVGGETIRFIVPYPKLLWGSTGRRPLAGDLDDW